MIARAAILAVILKLDDTLEDQGGGTYEFTEAALQEAPSGTGESATAIAEAVWDEILEGSYTGKQLMRVIIAALAGKVAGAATTTVTFRDTADSKNVISATVDANGNRSAVTLDVT